MIRGLTIEKPWGVSSNGLTKRKPSIYNLGTHAMIQNRCKPSVTFAGVIYLYEITQARHIPKPNFMTPTKLSNPEAAQNVILTTVKWNEVTPAIGEQRERELTENWSEMYKHGSQMARFNNTPESAKDVVGLILGRKLVTVGLIHQEFSRILGILPKQSLWSVFGGLLSTLFGRRRRVSLTKNMRKSSGYSILFQ